jgi:hypothetical protein
MDRKERDKLRNPEGCNVDVQKFTFTLVNTGRRGVSKCDVPVVIPRKVYVPEEGTPAPESPFAPIPPLVISNEETTVTCPDGQFGSDVIVESGAFTTTVSFYGPTLPRLTAEQERYVTNVVGTYREALQTGNLNQEQIRTSLKVPDAYAAILHELIVAGLTAVNTSAIAAAESTIVCLFRSIPIVVSCPSGTVGDSIARGEGFRTSVISQEDANELAIAATTPICLHCNDTVVVSCPPTDSDLLTVTGSTIIHAGTFCDVSKEVMLARLEFAKTSALANCIYCNKESYIIPCPEDALGDSVVVEANSICLGTPEEALAVLNEAINLAPVCDFYNTEVRCRCDDKADSKLSPLYELTVQAGTVPGESRKDANEQAMDICLSTLRCRWKSKRQSDSTCGSGEVAIVPGVAPAGFVVSDISQDDADERAKDIARQLTQCAGEDNDGGGGGGGVPGGGAGCSINACGPTAASQDIANWAIGKNADGKCQLAGLMSVGQGAGNIPENDTFELFCRYDIKFVDCNANEIDAADIPNLKALKLPYSYRLYIPRPDDIHTAKTCKECASGVSLIHDIQNPPDDYHLESPLKQLNLRGLKSTNDIVPNDGPCITFNTIGYTGTRTVVSDVNVHFGTETFYKTTEEWVFENGLLKTVDGSTGEGGGSTVVTPPTTLIP